ncbi:tetratricopeptide repeat protein [bacterium]|nr:tetratricopeptide repeat protein [bacterium]
MSTGPSGGKNRKQAPGFLGAVTHFLSTPSRLLAQRAERNKQRRDRNRADNIPKMTLGQSIISTLMFPFVATGEFLGTMFSGIGRYATTRNGLFLIQGIPAILVIAGSLAVGIIAFSTSLRKPELVKHFKDEGDAAMKQVSKETEDEKKRDKMLKRALLCYERWMMLDETDPEAKFNHARASFETKNPMAMQTALAEMTQLAPQNRPGGFERAHQWLANYYLTQLQQAKDPQAMKQFRDLAEVHLMRVLIADKDDYFSHTQLANLYIQQGRLEKAEKHLLVAVVIDKRALADLSKLYSRMNQKEKADTYAQQAMAYFQSLVDADPDNLDYRFILADQYMVRKDFQGAVNLLEDGIKLNRDPKINKKVSQLLLEAMQDIPTEEFEKRLEFFDKAISIDPQNQDAFRYILYYLTQSNPIAQMAQDRIDTALASSNSPTLHVLLSDHFLKEGKPELARKHLEAVLRTEPSFLAALNNLANVYAMIKPPDYDRALEYINTCLKYSQEQKLGDDSLGFFYDTRGQIYTMRRQWREAVADLEKAVGYGLNSNVATHNALLRCYQELNKRDLADEEIRIIAKLKEVQAEQDKAGKGVKAP